MQKTYRWTIELDSNEYDRFEQYFNKTRPLEPHVPGYVLQSFEKEYPSGLTLHTDIRQEYPDFIYTEAILFANDVPLLCSEQIESLTESIIVQDASCIYVINFVRKP